MLIRCTSYLSAAAAAVLFLLAADDVPLHVSGFVLSAAGSSRRITAAPEAAHSTTSLYSSQAYANAYSAYQNQNQVQAAPSVAASGRSWNGQRWEGQGQPQYQQRPAAPMIRYSTLTEPEKASLAAGATSSSSNSYYGRTTSPYGMPPQYQTPEPAVELPPFSKDIQGGSRGTWTSDGRDDHDQVQVTMMTDGRPLHADVHVYQGPDNTPQRMRVYSEDGLRRPFTTMIQTPQGAAKTAAASLCFNPYSLRDSSKSLLPSAHMATGGSHSISIINRGPMEFPIAAGVEGKGTTPPEHRAAKMADYSGRSRLFGKNEEIHGGHLKTYPFDPSVASVMVRVQSQGLPIMAVVELWQVRSMCYIL